MRDALLGGGDPEALAAPLPHLAPAEQLEVYRSQWFSRLRDVLLDDFPGVAAVLGREEFDALCRDYLSARAPRHWDISLAGDRLPAFLAERGGDSFAADLARLEWAVTSTFDAPDGPVLDPADLAGIDPERLAAARFPLSSTARILDFDHTVNGVLDAVRGGAGSEAPIPVPPPAPETVLVFRNGTRVHRMSLPRPLRTVLMALRDGATLEEAVERGLEGAEGVTPEEVTARFGEWASGGVFAEAELR